MKPFGNRLLARRSNVSEIDGISIPFGTTIGNEPCVGEVVAVPPHRKEIKVGDKILFAPAQSLRIYVQEEELYLASYDVVFAVV